MPSSSFPFLISCHATHFKLVLNKEIIWKNNLHMERIISFEIYYVKQIKSSLIPVHLKNMCVCVCKILLYYILGGLSNILRFS